MLRFSIPQHWDDWDGKLEVSPPAEISLNRIPGENRQQLVVRPAESIKGPFHLTVTATEQRPPEYSAYLTEGEEGGKASRLKATSSLTIVPIGVNQCVVSYSSEITIAGRLGKFGAGVMRKIADKTSDKFVTALQAEIATDAAH